MPSGVVEDENDGSMKASAGLACEGSEQRLEERLRDAVMHIPEGLAARGRHEGGDVEPVETMMPWRDRAFADRRPDPPRNRLQAEPMLVAREDLDRPFGMFRGFLGDGEHDLQRDVVQRPSAVKTAFFAK